MYFLLHSPVRCKLGALCLLLRLKSRKANGASRHLAFMDNCPTIITTVSPIYLVDEKSHFLFRLFLPHRPTQQGAGWGNLVCVECLWMIKQMVVGFVGIWCYSGGWVRILRALAQFKGSEGSPGLFQDFEDGYIKV